MTCCRAFAHSHRYILRSIPCHRILCATVARHVQSRSVISPLILSLPCRRAGELQPLRPRPQLVRLVKRRHGRGVSCACECALADVPIIIQPMDVYTCSDLVVTLYVTEWFFMRFFSTTARTQFVPRALLRRIEWRARPARSRVLQLGPDLQIRISTRVRPRISHALPGHTRGRLFAPPRSASMRSVGVSTWHSPND